MAMLDLTIREYQTADWAAVCRIHDQGRAVELSGVVPKDEIITMERAAAIDGFFDDRTFLAVADGAAMGFVAIRPPELTWCYVDPAFFRRGVGRKLVEYVLPILGGDAFVLCIAENPVGRAFYQSLGFVIAARFPGEADGYRCQCIRLTLPGSSHRRRPPTPTVKALRLAGFTHQNPGQAILGDDGIFLWK